MFAVAGGKGGVGRTSVALGLALALARAGRDPLVVDSDRDMPDLARRAGIPPAPGVAAVADGAPVAATAQAAGPGSLRVLPLAPGTDADAIRVALARVRAHDGPVLVDCPAGAGRDAARPLRSADAALIVSTVTPASLRDAAKTAAMARALDADVEGAVLTRTAGPGADRSRDPAGLERLLGCPVVACVPETDSPVEGAADARPEGPVDRPIDGPAARRAYRRCISSVICPKAYPVR